MSSFQAYSDVSHPQDTDTSTKINGGLEPTREGTGFGLGFPIVLIGMALGRTVPATILGIDAEKDSTLKAGKIQGFQGKSLLYGTTGGDITFMIGARAATPLRLTVKPNPVWTGSGAGSFTI